MKKMCMFWAAVGLVAAVVTACGGSDTAEEATPTEPTAATTTTTPASPAPGTSPPAAGGATITIEGMAFGAPLTVAPGTEITVANNDSAEHSVTSQTAGAFDLHVDGRQKATLIAPSQPGEYPFYCIYHPSMKGTLIVK
jgi:plastocyanin